MQVHVVSTIMKHSVTNLFELLRTVSASTTPSLPSLFCVSILSHSPVFFSLYPQANPPDVLPTEFCNLVPRVQRAWLTYDRMRCISCHTIHFNRATHFLFCVMASSHDSPGSPVEIFPNHSPEISSFKEQTLFQQDHIRFYTITVQKIGRKNTRKNNDFSKKCLNLVQVSLLTIGRFVNDAIRIRNVNSENLLLILFNVTIHNVYLVAFVPVGCLLDERHLLGVGIRNVDDVIEHNFHAMVRCVGRSRKERKHIDTCENDAWHARKERPKCGSRLHWTEHVLKLTYFDEVNCERENTMVVRSEHIVVHLLLSFTHTNLQPRTSF